MQTWYRTCKSCVHFESPMAPISPQRLNSWVTFLLILLDLSKLHMLLHANLVKFNFTLRLGLGLQIDSIEHITYSGINPKMKLFRFKYAYCAKWTTLNSQILSKLDIRCLRWFIHQILAKINIHEHILPIFHINFINILVITIKYKETFNNNFILMLSYRIWSETLSICSYGLKC